MSDSSHEQDKAALVETERKMAHHLGRLIEAVRSSEQGYIDPASDVPDLFGAAFGDCAPWWGWTNSVGFDLPSEILEEIRAKEHASTSV